MAAFDDEIQVVPSLALGNGPAVLKEPPPSHVRQQGHHVLSDPSSAPTRAIHAFEQDEARTGEPLQASRARTIATITALTAVTFTNSMSTGLITIGIPQIATDLQLPTNLLLWPASVFSLTCGCCLLLAGSVADMTGNRNINLAGTLLVGLAIGASGGAQTGIQFIVFRSIQGVGAAMCFPTAVSVLTSVVPRGPTRNFAFASLGLVQPLGFQVGMLLSGFFADSALTWRFPFYLCAGATALFFGVSCWCLPKDRPGKALTWGNLRRGIDWVGIGISSSSLGMMSYVFAVLTGSLSEIHDATNIVLLTISGALAVLFVFWMHFQVKHGRPALIPNSLWRNMAFSSICLTLLLSWAVLNSMEWFFSLYYQQVQQLSAIQASLRFLPNVILGIAVNVVTGLVVHRFPVNLSIVSTTAVSAISPLLMAFINPSWSWWLCAFWAVLIGPISADVIFTVANLLITDTFPEDTQALAGAVFNTVAQFGASLGIVVMAVISASATEASPFADKTSPEALMVGYRAVFWACLALTLVATFAGYVGLRKAGKVGIKKDQ